MHVRHCLVLRHYIDAHLLTNFSANPIGFFLIFTLLLVNFFGNFLKGGILFFLNLIFRINSFFSFFFLNNFSFCFHLSGGFSSSTGCSFIFYFLIKLKYLLRINIELIFEEKFIFSHRRHICLSSGDKSFLCKF